MARIALHRGALALALFALSGHVSGITHFLLVPHAVCAAHGELVHIDDVASIDGNTREDHAPHVARTGREVADGHEHCSISALRRPQLVIASTQVVAVQQPHSRQAEIDFEALHSRAFSILFFAPKASPPLAHA